PPSGIHSLSLHDALPIFWSRRRYGHRPGPDSGKMVLLRPGGPNGHRAGDLRPRFRRGPSVSLVEGGPQGPETVTGGTGGNFSRTDRKSTRLNSSHVSISY